MESRSLKPHFHAFRLDRPLRARNCFHVDEAQFGAVFPTLSYKGRKRRIRSLTNRRFLSSALCLLYQYRRRDSNPHDRKAIGF